MNVQVPIPVDVVEESKAWA